ncbi:hypothetical protein [Halobacteriovorax sp. ZH4_bin.1]|uniref:hypothetical protein n=1 Tax=unclassified Halobacteriovorax TaxID=2639665 RepID=UPI003718445F
MELDYVELPERFCQLLLSDVSSSSNTSVDLQRFLFESPAMARILYRILNGGEETDLTSLVKKYGWHGIRDRLLAYYMNFLYNSNHPHAVLTEEVEDIKKIESRFRDKTVSGYSRLISLGMYLKVSCYESDLESIEEHPYFPDRRIDQLLAQSKNRNIRIDILILMLVHFLKYLGEEKLFGLIRAKQSFETIESMLATDQKYQLQKNIINYALSIGDTDLIASKTV